MPRRSNKFQALVLRIYAAMESVHGAKVEESVLLPEEHADSRREVDVLVTRLVGGRSMRIAIEARDHDRGQDITWVDSLIGKYHDLGVNAVIAISHSPFTRTAEQKAIHHRIQLLELREAESVDWAAALGPGLLSFFACQLRLMFVGAFLNDQEIFRVTANFEEELLSGDPSLWPVLRAMWLFSIKPKFAPRFISMALADWERVLAKERNLRYLEYTETFSKLQVIREHVTWRRYAYEKIVWGIGIKFTADNVAPSRWALGGDTIADLVSATGVDGKTIELTVVTKSGQHVAATSNNRALSLLPPPFVPGVTETFAA